MTAFRTEQDFHAPRPLFSCLDSAIRCALHNGTIPAEMIRERWSQTYHCTVEQFDEALLRALTRIAPNSNEGIEGK